MLEEILYSLILTIIFEFFVLILLKVDTKILIMSIFVNFITNVPLNIFLTLANFPNVFVYSIVVAILEIGIFIFEGLIYYLVTQNLKKSLIYSFVANLSSFVLGLVLAGIAMFIFV